jgi:hypothetical protein
MTPGPAREPDGATAVRFAVMSDTHLAPAGTQDGRWNNVLRRSVSGQLVEAAVGDIAAAGHDRVMLLGDVSDLGTADAVRAVLAAASAAGLQPWAVPGNHDVSSDPDTVAQAVAGCAGSVAVRREHLGGPGQILVCGPGLRSPDGGQTCQATGLPDLAGERSRLLLWTSHYPALSMAFRLRPLGLRYSGDLENLPDVQAVIGGFRGPVLVLHGHLHTSVVGQDGPVLQIGVPAIVEWPHAWTEVSIHLASDEVIVTTALIPVSGAWSSADVNTVLDGTEQHWVSDGSRWRQS